MKKNIDRSSLAGPTRGDSDAAPATATAAARKKKKYLSRKTPTEVYREHRLMVYYIEELWPGLKRFFDREHAPALMEAWQLMDEKDPFGKKYTRHTYLSRIRSFCTSHQAEGEDLLGKARSYALRVEAGKTVDPLPELANRTDFEDKTQLEKPNGEDGRLDLWILTAFYLSATFAPAACPNQETLAEWKNFAQSSQIRKLKDSICWWIEFHEVGNNAAQIWAKQVILGGRDDPRGPLKFNWKVLTEEEKEQFHEIISTISINVAPQSRSPQAASLRKDCFYPGQRRKNEIVERSQIFL